MEDIYEEYFVENVKSRNDKENHNGKLSIHFCRSLLLSFLFCLSVSVSAAVPFFLPHLSLSISLFSALSRFVEA